MLIRSPDLADRMSGIQQPEIFTLPIDAARLKAREILNRLPQGGYVQVVENWRSLSDGQIEFTMRHLPTVNWRN
jgi:hypothetical protein